MFWSKQVRQREVKRKKNTNNNDGSEAFLKDATSFRVDLADADNA